MFVVAAGPADAVATCQPLFDAVGQRSFNMGETPHKANIVKLSGNFLIMTVIESLAEAMTLAGKYGVDKGTLLDTLTGSVFGGIIYEVYGKVLVEENFEPAGFTLPLGFKDMTLVAEAAVAAGRADADAVARPRPADRDDGAGTARARLGVDGENRRGERRTLMSPPRRKRIF